MKPLVSVIIPTYRDWPRLLLCLNALANQSLPREDFEIIVVDNDPDRHEPPSLPPAIRCLYHPDGYSYAARNAGAATARGDVLAFTDADCLPSTNWLSEGLAELSQHPEWHLLGGHIDVSATKENAAVRYERLFEFQQQALIQNWQFSVTANLFVRRSVFQLAGGFDDRWVSCGDADFCQRVVLLGYGIGYGAAAVVVHPAREFLTEILRKNRRVSAGEYSRLRHRFRHASLWPALIHAFRLRPREWALIIMGGRGSEKYPIPARWGVLGIRVLLHYQAAWTLLMSHLSSGKTNAHVR